MNYKLKDWQKSTINFSTNKEQVGRLVSLIRTAIMQVGIDVCKVCLHMVSENCLVYFALGLDKLSVDISGDTC